MNIKSEILSELEKNNGKNISGQALADKCKVSRNAVWKAINSLKADGYSIDSATNRGYCLLGKNDIISKEGIRLELCEECKDIEIFTFKEIDSTNGEAKRRITDGLKERALFVSECQTHGRGRRGRTFFSPENTGIYMTFALHPNSEITDAISITTATSVAVVRALEKFTDKELKIKWVNDIYMDGKKICGILTEAITDFEAGIVQSVIIGIGINVSTKDFPPEIGDVASSLQPKNVNRNKIIAEIVNNLDEITYNLKDCSYMEDYRSHSLVLGKDINYFENGEKFEAKVIKINDNGSLEVESGSERKILQSGEITVRMR